MSCQCQNSTQNIHEKDVLLKVIFRFFLNFQKTFKSVKGWFLIYKLT